MRAVLRIGGFALVLAMLARPAAAVPVTIDFEGLNEGPGDLVFSGLTFLNASVLSSSGGLNADYPPRSGQNVVLDDGGPMSIFFTDLVYSLSGYFTYAFGPLTLTAYDAAANIIGSVVTSLFSENTVLFGEPGSSPNELLQFSSTTGIASVTFMADPFGGSFTLDDFTYDTDPTSGTPPPPVQSVPEPGTLTLLLLGGAGLVAARRRKR